MLFNAVLSRIPSVFLTHVSFIIQPSAFNNMGAIMLKIRTL